MGNKDDYDKLRMKIIGLGEKSMRKSYYPELQKKLIELKIEANKYRDIFDNAVTGIFRSNKEGKFLDLNPAMAEIFGFDSPESFIKEINVNKSQKYIDSHHKENLFKLVEKKGEVKNFECNCFKKDGTKIWGLIYAKPIYDERKRIIFIQGIFIDMTQQKMAEKTRQELIRKLKNVKIAQEQFFSMLGHFLKNQLQSIILELELLSPIYKAKRDLKAEEITRLKEQLLYSSQTIDKVSHIFKVLQNSSIGIQSKYSLMKTIETAIKMVESDYSSILNINNLSPIGKDVEIKADENFLVIFTEIFSFIAKSNSKMTTLQISSSKNSCKVVIENYGSRIIPDEERNIISGNFSDKWSSQDSYLGLSLSSMILSQYGGKMTISSITGGDQGNCFELLFPSNVLIPKI